MSDFIQKLFTTRQNYNNGDSRIGERERIWYDSNTNTFRIQLDDTPGGTVIGTGGSGGSYTLPTASTTVKGGVKIDGTTITINNGVISAHGGSGASVTESASPPNNPHAGDMWWDTTSGNLFIYYDSNWVPAVATTIGPQGLQGPKGDTGDRGATGPKGDTGATGLQGDKGNTGDRGATGAKGDKGDPGVNGTNGLSAYEIAVADVFSGTELQWLASLIGPKGDQGNPGAAAHVTESNTPPSSPTAGDMWWDTVSGDLFIYYDSSWVSAMSVTTPVNADWNATSGLAEILNKPAPYSLPTASTTVKGGVKVDGTTITINGSGVISSTGSVTLTSSDVTTALGYTPSAQIKMTFSYSDLPTSPIRSVPAGAIIKEVCIILLTAFDATSTLSVGSTANHTELMDTTDITTRATGTYTTEPAYKYTTNTELVLSITAGASSQGNGIVIVYYE